MLKGLPRFYGKFRCSINFIDSNTYWKIFNNVKIIEAKYDLYSDRIEYLAWSPWFKTVDYGEIIPEYDISFSNEGLDVLVNGEKVEQICWDN